MSDNFTKSDLMTIWAIEINIGRAPGRNERVQFLVLNQPSLICQPGWMCVRLFLDLNTACIMFDLHSMCKPIVQAWNYWMDMSSQGIIELFTETFINPKYIPANFDPYFFTFLQIL